MKTTIGSRGLRLAWTGACALAMTLLMASCGGSGSSSGSGQFRVINATRTHASIDVLVSSTKTISAVAKDAVSSYASVGSGAASLSVTDAGSTTALASSAPTVTKDTSYALLVFESNGSIRTSWIGESDTKPSAGTASLRILHFATDAGALDVFVAPQSTDISTVTSASFSLPASTSLQVSSFVNFTPGTYKVRVTGAGNRSDVRLDMSNVALGDQQLVNLFVTPGTGGTLVDGGTLIEQGNYAAARNTLARVRVVSGIPSATISVANGSQAIETGAASPWIGNYATVAAGTGNWSVTVNNVAASVAPFAPVAGNDYTLLLTTASGQVQANLVADDNHAPTVSTVLNLRLVNALSNSNTALALSADFAGVASNVTPGQASAYRAVSGDSQMRLELTSPSSLVPLWLQTGLNMPAGGVYNVFVVGDGSAPIAVLRRDR